MLFGGINLQYFYQRLLRITFQFFQIRRIDFPREAIKGDTLFTNMIIDETTSRPENNCDDVYVYITDTIKPGKKFEFITFV